MHGQNKEISSLSMMLHLCATDEESVLAMCVLNVRSLDQYATAALSVDRRRHPRAGDLNIRT